MIERALESADPERILEQALSLDRDRLYIHNNLIGTIPVGKLVLLSIGKAAAPMARATSRLLPLMPENVIIVRPDYDQSEIPAGWRAFQAGHPLPTSGSLAAGQAVQAAIHTLGERDLVIVLLSGGGSALLELPRPGLDLEDLRRVNQDLLRSGAPIEEINVVRKSMSSIKGGGLARMASPAQTLTLILSDVVGDDLSVIASGPTVLESDHPERAREILKGHGLWKDYPQHLRRALLTHRADPAPMRPPQNVLLANNHTVTHAVAGLAAELGFSVELNDKPLTGEARRAGMEFARHLVALRDEEPDRSHCLIQGGETSVTVRGEGKGGRNQEFALAAALELSAHDRAALLSLATDGVDGPTDAAGALVSPDTLGRARSLGLDPVHHLDHNDAYPLLHRVGALIRTGPTMTNLNDIAIGLIYAES